MVDTRFSSRDQGRYATGQSPVLDSQTQRPSTTPQGFNEPEEVSEEYEGAPSPEPQRSGATPRPSRRARGKEQAPNPEPQPSAGLLVDPTTSTSAQALPPNDTLTEILWRLTEGQNRRQPKELKTGEIKRLEKREITQYNNFVADVEDYFVARPLQCDTEDKKVLFAVSHLGNEPKTRWRQENPQGATWETMKDFLKQWVDPEADRGQRAFYRLLNEQQGNRAGTQWITRYEETWEMIGDLDPKTHIFIESLQPEIRSHIARMPNPPKTMKDASRELLRLESIIQRERKEKNPRPRSDNSHKNQQDKYEAKRRRTDTAPTGVNQESSNRSSSPKENRRRREQYNKKDKERKKQQALREEQAKKGLCFNCNKTGHRAADCPEKADKGTKEE